MSQVFVPSSGGLTSPVAVADGGTGGTTPIDAKNNLDAASSGANADITSLTGTTEISNASLALGAMMGAMSFYGADVVPQQGASNSPLSQQEASYNQAALNTSLNSLEAGINEVITALQTIGLIA